MSMSLTMTRWNVLVYEPKKLEVFAINGISYAELQRLDDEENYVIVDPMVFKCFLDGEWHEIPEGKFDAGNQLTVIAKG